MSLVNSKNPFAGEWADEEGQDINVGGKDGNLTVIYGTGRGPFNGYYVHMAAWVVTINFTDDHPSTGVLVEGTTIQWSNGTSWFKK